jgi:hypothetical protein
MKSYKTLKINKSDNETYIVAVLPHHFQCFARPDNSLQDYHIELCVDAHDFVVLVFVCIKITITHDDFVDEFTKNVTIFGQTVEVQMVELLNLANRIVIGPLSDK